jgi:hypothetical protein
MGVPCPLSRLAAVLTLVLISPRGHAVEIDVEASTSGGATRNLFSDSTDRKDTYSSSSVELNWYPRSFARVNLAGEYSYYGNFFNLSNLVYGGGLTIIPMPDSSRFSTYLEGNLKKREYRQSEEDSNAVNANEITGDEQDVNFGAGYCLNSNIQLRTGFHFKSTKYELEGVIDHERADVITGANATLFGSVAIDLELGYSTGKYQHVDPMVLVPGIPEFGIPDTTVPRLAIRPGEQYSILLVDRLKSFFISPRLSGSLGRKTGLAVTYSYRRFIDYNDSAVIYGYSTGYLSPWLGDYAGQAVILKSRTYLVPGLVISFSAGFWEREHISTVERELKTNRFGQIVPTINLLYAQERTDWRRRFDLRFQLPLHLGKAATLEPSLEIDYTDNNSTVAVYDYDDFALRGGVTIRF